MARRRLETRFPLTVLSKTGDGSFQVVGRTTHREARGRVTRLLEVLEMTVGMPGFTFGRGTENSRNADQLDDRSRRNRRRGRCWSCGR